MPSAVRVTLLNALNAMIHDSSEASWDLIGGVARLRTTFQAEQVSRDGLEKGLAESVHGEQGRDDGGGFDGLDALRRPVNVSEAQPQGELVERQRESDTKDDCDAQMPLLRASGQGDESGGHQEQDAPKQMMDVQPARGHHVAERPVREDTEVDDGGQSAQDAERDQKGEERAERDAPTKIETCIVMTDAHAIMVQRR